MARDRRAASAQNAAGPVIESGPTRCHRSICIARRSNCAQEDLRRKAADGESLDPPSLTLREQRLPDGHDGITMVQAHVNGPSCRCCGQSVACGWASELSARRGIRVCVDGRARVTKGYSHAGGVPYRCGGRSCRHAQVAVRLRNRRSRARGRVVPPSRWSTCM